MPPTRPLRSRPAVRSRGRRRDAGRCDVGQYGGRVSFEAATGPTPHVTIRRAVPADAMAIRDLVQLYAENRILLAKELVGYFEAIPEFLVAVDDASGRVIGCGALHVMWSDLAEVRTLAVHPDLRRRGVGHLLLAALLERAREYGLRRVFCLTFEVDFFSRHGFEPIQGTPIDPEVFSELLRSHDDGVAEFLDLAHVKPNTLGNTRMLVTL